MAVLGYILLWLGVGLLALFAFALITPVQVRGYLRSAPDLSYRIDLRIFGGLLPALPLADSRRPRRPMRKSRKTKKARSKNRKLPRGVAALIPELIKDLLGVIMIEHLRVDAAFGLADPAQTGQLYGVLSPLQFAVPLPNQLTVSLRPDFSRPCFAAELDGALHFTAAALLPPLGRFAWRAFGPGR